MRLMIAGGGGFRVPLVYRALSTGTFAGLVRELVLFDVDPLRLAAINAVLSALGSSLGGRGPAVRTTTSLAEGLEGTDMVFAAIRPGGTAGRTADERVALDLGLLGQETTGAGGISYALRSIPGMLELAREMRQRCPDAWLVNFTNPAGMVTEALVPVLGKRVIGICDSAGALAHRAARAAGAPLPDGRLDGVGYYGLNHLGWLYRLESGGSDLLPGLLADAQALSGFEEGRLFPQPFLQSLGCLPNEYLYYYYDTPGPSALSAQCCRPAANPSMSSSRSCTRPSPRQGPVPTNCGTPPAAPGKRDTWPRPAPTANSGTKRTSPAAGTNGLPSG